MPKWLHVGEALLNTTHYVIPCAVVVLHHSGINTTMF